MAVFLPTALPGRYHRPALSAVRAHDRGDSVDQRHQRGDAQAGPVRPVAAAARAAEAFFTRVQPGLRRLEAVYAAIVRRMVRHRWLVMLLFAGLIALTVWWYQRAADRLFARRRPRLRARRRAACPTPPRRPGRSAWSSKVDQILGETPGVDRLGHHRRPLDSRQQLARRTRRLCSLRSALGRAAEARPHAGGVAGHASRRVRHDPRAIVFPSRRRRSAAWACAAASR